MPADSVRTGSVDGRGANTVRLTPSYAALVWALLGLAASAYLTVEHYTASTLLACPENATINCAKVTTSKWSVGRIFSIAAVVCSPAAIRLHHRTSTFGRSRTMPATKPALPTR